MAEKDDGLARLVEEGIIDAVHSRLMSGKEATVYIVERGGNLGAAKVYRARDDRTFKKTASYVEGRNQTRNSRDRRAMQNKTAYGRGLIEVGWQDMEFQALRAAFDAGVRVPEPYFLYENVLFMELLVDAQGAPALRLADCHLTSDEATRLHLEVFRQVKALLAIGRIHGDLSAYNVLMAAQGPTLIDMPQMVDVAGNNNARHILRRDLRNVTLHLARYDARLMRFSDCGDRLFYHLTHGTLDQVSEPEIGVPFSRAGGSGRRGYDAERGRVGRLKGQRPNDVHAPHSGHVPRQAPANPHDRASHARPNSAPRPPVGAPPRQAGIGRAAPPHVAGRSNAPTPSDARPYRGSHKGKESGNANAGRWGRRGRA